MSSLFQPFTLSTGFGAWNAIFWVCAFGIAFFIAYLIWARGEKTYNTSNEALAPFLSGNEEPSKDAVHIRAGNLYWGYTEALSGYYRFVKPFHTGNLSDYFLAYLLVTALVLVVVVILP